MIKHLWILLLAPIFAFADDGTSKLPLGNVLPEARPVEYASDYKPHIGGSFGYADVDGPHRPGMLFGLDIGYQPYIPFAVGLQIDQTFADGDGSRKDLSRITVLAKGTYNFGGTIPVLRESFIGLGVGRIIDDGRGAWAMAPMLGFDIPFKSFADNRMMSLGAMARYTMVNPEHNDVLSLTGAAKYWF